MAHVLNSKKLDDVNAADFDAVFLPGGACPVSGVLLLVTCMCVRAAAAAAVCALCSASRVLLTLPTSLRLLPVCWCSAGHGTAFDLPQNAVRVSGDCLSGHIHQAALIRSLLALT